MEESERKKQELKKKIVSWFSNKTNLLLVLLIIAAIIIRFHYFSLTDTQALWWDEAEYGLKAKAFAFGTPLTGWASEREVIVPFIFSLFLRFGFTEIGLRIVQLLVSLATVFMTYVVISKLTSKNIGFFAAFGMTFFWLHIFFSMRLLLYLWAPLIFLGIVYFFYTGYVQKSRKNLILFSILSAIGLMTYFSVGFLLFGIFVYLLFTEKMGLFKNKRAWKAFLLFFVVLLPFMIYFQMTYGFPIPRLAVGFRATTQEAGAGLSGLFEYIKMFPSRAGMVFTLLSFAGVLIFLVNLFLGFGIKENMEKNRKLFLLLIAFVVPLGIYTLYGVVGGSGTFYDAFILPVFPFAFGFAGYALSGIQNFASKYGKYAGIAVVIVLLGIHSYSGLKTADSSIKEKISSYDSVKLAGLWIKENSYLGDVIVTSSPPQISYYSEREAYNLPLTREEFEKFVVEKKPRYILDSLWEGRRDWLNSYLDDNMANMSVVNGYFFDEARQQPSLLIYQPKYS